MTVDHLYFDRAKFMRVPYRQIKIPSKTNMISLYSYTIGGSESDYNDRFLQEFTVPVLGAVNFEGKSWYLVDLTSALGVKTTREWHLVDTDTVTEIGGVLSHLYVMISAVLSHLERRQHGNRPFMVQ